MSELAPMNEEVKDKWINDRMKTKTHELKETLVKANRLRNLMSKLEVSSESEQDDKEYEQIMKDDQDILFDIHSFMLAVGDALALDESAMITINTEQLINDVRLELSARREELEEIQNEIASMENAIRMSTDLLFRVGKRIRERKKTLRTANDV